MDLGLNVRKDTKTQEKEMRMGAAADKFGGGRGQEMEHVHTHWPRVGRGGVFCEVLGGKAFVLSPAEALAVGEKGAAGKSNSCMLFCFVLFVFLAVPCSMWDLSSGIKPSPPAWEARSLNHWTTMEVPLFVCLFVVLAGGGAVWPHHAA